MRLSPSQRKSYCIAPGKCQRSPDLTQSVYAGASHSNNAARFAAALAPAALAGQLAIADQRRRTFKLVTATAAKPSVPTASEQDQAVEKKIRHLRELFAGGPWLGKRRWRTRCARSSYYYRPRKRHTADRTAGWAVWARYPSSRIIVPLARGRAKRLRGSLRLLGGKLAPPAMMASERHIDDFVTQIPDYLD